MTEAKIQAQILKVLREAGAYTFQDDCELRRRRSGRDRMLPRYISHRQDRLKAKGKSAEHRTGINLDRYPMRPSGGIAT